MLVAHPKREGVMPRNSGNTKAKNSPADYIPLGVSILALLFSMYQFFVFKDIDKTIKELSAENTQLDNAIKQMEVADKEFKQKIQFENRYLVANSSAIDGILHYDKPGNGFTKSILTNKVLGDFNAYIKKDMRENDPSFIYYEYTTPVSDSLEVSHGLVILKIHNISSNRANNVKLIVKWRDFPNYTVTEVLEQSGVQYPLEELSKRGNSFVNLWEIKDNYQSWSTETIQIADIAPDGEVIIPLAHVMSTNYYFGRVFMPDRLEWDNPVLGKQENTIIGNMVPSDQWLFASEFGANIHLAQ